MDIRTTDFGLGSSLITIINKQGVKISFTNLGARIVDWQKDGKHLILGFDSAQEYIEKDAYPGATVGRTAGRIKDGLVALSGETIQLDQNDGLQTLHGGDESMHTKLWRYEIIESSDKVAVKFSLTSNAGENGYPGQLKMVVTHSFDNDNHWQIDYEATTTTTTVFNPTGHVYFNLTGDASQTVDDHHLSLAASRFVPLKDKTEVIRGDIVELKDTALDFRSGRKLTEALHADLEQVQLVGGIDHPFLLDEVGLAKEQARLTLDDIAVSVYTDRPSIVIFTANFGDLGTVFHGQPIAHHGGITFECQIAPGSQQLPELGNITLKAGDTYKATTIYKLD
ncbi:aldose epimerase family protein [Pseudolactococcus reticulitermitis]|uniref:Aldose 1-epimerase n=1 Tax=Pseudolactococcus reticulitermitis TaxID=2025039 RepID=A0A224XAG5_9LACT|nr:galactose-1-epimerase [Lactococcus reticulitermitis]GAX47154.1 galactose mutarotase [Lactococcus reticulitermitis]